MDFDEIKRLIELMNENDLLELEHVEDSKKIRLKKKYEGGPKIIAAAPLAAAQVPPAAAPQATEAAGVAGPPEGTREIKSPMVGTFYRSANPESPSYVEEGDHVDEDSVICIVEAMKVFNEIKAEMAGTVVTILVESGQSVEYAQPMFIVKPD